MADNKTRTDREWEIKQATQRMFSFKSGSNSIGNLQGSTGQLDEDRALCYAVHEIECYDEGMGTEVGTVVDGVISFMSWNPEGKDWVLNSDGYILELREFDIDSFHNGYCGRQR